MNKDHIALNSWVKGGVVVLLAVASLSLLVGMVRGKGRSVNEPIPQITVNGTGEVFAVADTATISFDVRKEAKDMALAQKQVNDIVTAVVSGLKGMNIADKDIKTIGYNSYPVYDNQSPCIYSSRPCPVTTPTIRGYEVSQSITVKVRKTDQAGAVVSYLGTKGVSNISGPNFTVDNDDALRTQAREKAIADAKTKAELLAKQLGVRLVRIVSFGENGNYPYPVYDRAVMSGGKGGAEPAPATLPTGQNSYTSTVTISYEIR